MSRGIPGPEIDERQLVEQARVDIESFAELYRRYLPRIHAFAWRRTGNVEAAEDVCSATFEAALRNLEQFQWRPGGFGPWLFRIASNQTVAHHRREARPAGERGQVALARLHQPLADDGIDTMLQLIDNDSADLQAALDRLTPRYQQAIALRYLADLGPEDAARAMGLAKPALAVVLSRALKALRRELDAAAAPTGSDS